MIKGNIITSHVNDTTGENDSWAIHKQTMSHVEIRQNVCARVNISMELF